MIAVIGLAAAAASCNARVREERQVWNLYKIEAALDANTPIAVSETYPDGVPPGDFLTRNPNNVTLKVQRAFAEGAPAAFVTTEMWVNSYDAVWTQPLYAPAIDPTTLVPDARRVIDVGPDSSFYSPFWQVNLAVVGNVPANRYQSAKKVLDDASQIIPVGTRTCPLRPLDGPDEVVGTLALPKPWDAWNVPLQTVPTLEAVRDDEGNFHTFGLLDFGPNLFELEVETHGAIVEASPMFAFAKPDGTLYLDEPHVLGAGDVATDPAGPRPRYGGLWHLHKVFLPGSAGPFHGSEHPAARDASTADPLEYEGRFALDTACFNDAGNFPGGCMWLDSQEKLEAVLGEGHLQPTEITQTGPIVLWQKKAVPVNQ